jgi:hypothetical protein
LQLQNSFVAFKTPSYILLQQNLSHISSHSSFVLLKKEKKNEGEILLFYANSSNIEFGLCCKKAISFKSWLVTQNPFAKLNYI